ncbi:MAG: SusC/RagA family TonB-linked outer membrane protein [Gemmatimonadota bacterium]|mgnify:CR=1 FL=1
MANLRSTLRHIASVALLSSLATGSILAQGTAVVPGQVLAEKGAVQLGASVQMPQFNKVVAVDSRGNYRIEVPATNQMATFTARALGRSPVTKEIALAAGSHKLDFTLSSTIRLTEVVVTGVAAATDQKLLAIGVGKVGAEAMSQVPGSSPLAALAGKMAGARVAMPRGTPGGNPIIKLRGSTNLTPGGSAPLLVVDGVITRGDLQDIDANDIESIEVLKGAASSNTYGSSAANGVIAITTKRGKGNANNKVSFTTRTEIGSGSQERFVPLNKHHYFQLNPDGSFVLGGGRLRVPETDRLADNEFPAGTWRNQQKLWMQNGDYQNTFANMAVRRGNTNLSTSYSFEHNQGILPFVDGERRRNFRLNADQAITSKIDVSISSTYALNTNDQNPEGSGPFFALLQAPPDVDLRRPWGPTDSVAFNPYLPPAYDYSSRGNPLYDLTVRDNRFRRERMIGSGVIRYRPFTWLSFDATYGTDRLNTGNQNYLKRGTFSSGALNTTLNGTYSTSANRAANSNTTINTNVAKAWGNLSSTTRLTYLQEISNTYNQSANTSKLNIDLPTINGGDVNSTGASSSQTLVRSENYFVTQGLNYKDRYLVQAMIRRDGSSLFGADARYHNFWGASGAYRLTEDVHIPGFQEVKLRAARGTAGLRPSFSSQYETYSLSGGTVSKNQIGNRALEPAVQTENEVGVNLEFLDRFSSEITMSDRKTVGAFLSVPLSSAKSGGFTAQTRNAADVSAHTLEAQISARLIDRSDLQWNMTVSGDRTRQYVDKLDRPPFSQAGGFGQAQGNQFWYRQGEALGVMYGDRYIKNPQDLLDNPVNKANASFSLDNYTKNAAGFVVLKSLRGTPGELPIKYVAPDGTTLQRIGDSNADFAWSMIQDVTWKSLSFHVLVDGMVGGNIYNFTKQWMFMDLRHGSEDGTAYPVADRIALGFFSSGLYNGLVSNAYFVEGGSYAKLRELSVNYSLSNKVLEMTRLNTVATGVRIALVGRNLKTWTSYTGADPETLGGDDFNYRIDGFRYPSLRQLSAQITITY